MESGRIANVSQETHKRQASTSCAANNSPSQARVSTQLVLEPMRSRPGQVLLEHPTVTQTHI